MGKKRARYENAGNIKTVQTVNFREPENIIQILQTFEGNEAMEGHLAELYCQMQTILRGHEFCKTQQKEILNFAVETKS